MHSKGSVRFAITLVNLRLNIVMHPLERYSCRGIPAQTMPNEILQLTTVVTGRLNGRFVYLESVVGSTVS